MERQNDGASVLDRSPPLIHQQAHETQPFNAVVKLPIALDFGGCHQSADTITPRDLYQKHHWQVSAHTFYQRHPLYNQHVDEHTQISPCAA